MAPMATAATKAGRLKWGGERLGQGLGGRGREGARPRHGGELGGMGAWRKELAARKAGGHGRGGSSQRAAVRKKGTGKKGSGGCGFSRGGSAKMPPLARRWLLFIERH
jgi:hypothetical protein